MDLGEHHAGRAAAALQRPRRGRIVRRCHGHGRGAPRAGAQRAPLPRPDRTLGRLVLGAGRRVPLRRHVARDAGDGRAGAGLHRQAALGFRLVQHARGRLGRAPRPAGAPRTVPRPAAAPARRQGRKRRHLRQRQAGVRPARQLHRLPRRRPQHHAEKAHQAQPARDRRALPQPDRAVVGLVLGDGRRPALHLRLRGHPQGARHRPGIADRQAALGHRPDRRRRGHGASPRDAGSPPAVQGFRARALQRRRPHHLRQPHRQADLRRQGRLPRLPRRGARHHRAHARRGGARAHGALRRAHRPAEPRAAAGAPEARDGARRPRPHAAGGAVPRPRPVQGDQRQPRARDRRRGAEGNRAAAGKLPARDRHRGQAGRRRVHHPARGRAQRRGDLAHLRQAAALDLRARRRLRPRAAPVDQHRRDRLPAGRPRRRHAAAQRGPGDVPRQAGGPQQRAVLRARHERAHREARRPAQPAARRGGAQGAAAALPAAGRRAQRLDHRRRGAAALDRPRARAGGALGVHSARRGHRADPADGRMGDARSLHPGQALAGCRLRPADDGGKPVGPPVPPEEPGADGVHHPRRDRPAA